MSDNKRKAAKRNAALAKALKRAQIPFKDDEEQARVIATICTVLDKSGYYIASKRVVDAQRAKAQRPWKGNSIPHDLL